MNELEKILKNLISFPTVSSRSNLDLISYIEQFLSPLKNIKTERFPDATNPQKSALLVQIGEGEGGLIFSGHSDVVPVEGQEWSYPPFELSQNEDKYFGRGVCDMKGFLACLLVNATKWANLALKRPIFFAISYDEEVGCDKSFALIQRLLEKKAEFAVIGEPSSLNPVLGQKGIVNLQTNFKGISAHSSQILSLGISAVHSAAKMIVGLENLMQQQIKDNKVNPDFDIPYSSIHIGMVNGGIAHNVLAENCQIDWEIRNLPETEMEDLIKESQKIAQTLEVENQGLKITTELTSPIVPALKNFNNEFLKNTILDFDSNLEPKFVAYATEAGYFQKAGFSTLICGCGDIRQAHQADEWILKSQIQKCAELVDFLVRKICC